MPASIVLQRSHDAAPADHFTLGWLMGSLRKRSFGIIMLLLERDDLRRNRKGIP